MTATPVADFLNECEAHTDRDAPIEYLPYAQRTTEQRITLSFDWRQSQIGAGLLYQVLVEAGIASSITNARALVRTERQAGALVNIGSGSTSGYRTAEMQARLNRERRDTDQRLRDLGRRAEALGLTVEYKWQRYGWTRNLADLPVDAVVSSITLGSSVEDVVKMLEATR